MQYRVVLLTLVLILTTATGFVFSSDNVRYEPRPRVSDPQVEAGGGGSVAYPEAAAAIRMNPAAFAERWRFLTRGAGSLAVRPAVRPQIGTSIISDGMLPLPRNFASAYAPGFDENGFGFGGSGELFLSGFNVGLGFFTDHEVFMRASGPAEGEDRVFADSEGYILSEAGLAAGIAVPFSAGPFEMSVGGAVRPILRVRGELDDEEEAVRDFASGLPFDEAFADTPVLNGFALALDAGVLAHYGNLSFGLSVRDIGGTAVDYREHPLAKVIEASADGRLPEGGDVLEENVSYVIPMQTRVGAAYSFDWRFLKPTVFADVYDPHRMFASNRGTLNARGHASLDSNSRRPVDHFSAGVDAAFLRFFSARAGISADGPSLGLGASLGPLRLDSSIRFSEGPASRASVGAQLRF